jgi:serine/threonine-protein kinase
VLEGSIRKAGNELRITVQLVNVADGYPLWSEKYERIEESIFDLQDEISLAIVDQLKLKLLGDEREKLVKRHTENIEAYNLYLEGMYFYQMYTPTGFDKAIEHFEQSLDKDPNFSLPYTGLAAVYQTMTFYGGIPPHEAFPQAKAYVAKALKIDPNLAEAHAMLGHIITYYDWDFKKADRELKQALKLDPNSAMAHFFYSHHLIMTGRFEESLVEAVRARELDPLSPITSRNVGLPLCYSRQWDKAIEAYKNTINKHPNDFFSHYMLGQAYRGAGRNNEAYAELEKAFELSGGDSLPLLMLGLYRYEDGEKVEAEKIFRELEQKLEHAYIPSTYFFLINVSRGDQDQALYWLERACDERDSFLLPVINAQGEVYGMPDDPRFNVILKKYGL